MKFRARIESVNLEKDEEYTKIILNRIENEEPIFDEIRTMMGRNEIVEVEIVKAYQ